MRGRRIVVLGLALAVSLVAGCSRRAGAPTGRSSAPRSDTIQFAILPAESQASMGPLWQPVLDDLAQATGLKVQPRFVANYTALIEAMRFNQVQAGWLSALPALEAVRRADGTVVARTSDAGGLETYRSVLIARAGSGMTLERVLKCDKTLSFGLGDVKSTSGTLAPMAYLFTPRDIDPNACFKVVRSASHQANLAAVANGVLDAATNNTVGLLFARREAPALAAKVQVLWTSPDLPESAIVARRDLDPAVLSKMRTFFVTYGAAAGEQGDRQRANLKRLNYSAFIAADDSYLQPVREMDAANTLAEARRSGDKDRVAAAEREAARVKAEPLQPLEAGR